VEDWISGPFPRNRQLLEMNHFITVHDFLNQLTCLFVIHRVNLTDAAFVSLLETLVLCLQLFEVLSERLVFLSQVDILLLVGALLIHKPFLDGSDK
jgi:hypothetical protein